jgi:hypothetical protein
VYCNSLSYFLDCEDMTRRDPLEDSSVYEPLGGLQITHVATGANFCDPRSLVSHVVRPHRIYVFCLSTVFNEHLWRKFNAKLCVRITDPQEFIARFRRATRRPQLRINCTEVLAAEVTYYKPDDPPASRHACPDQIILSKLEQFSDEREFRLAFSSDRDAFSVYNVGYELTARKSAKSFKHSHKLLQLGDLRDICELKVSLI